MPILSNMAPDRRMAMETCRTDAAGNNASFSTQRPTRSIKIHRGEAASIPTLAPDPYNLTPDLK